MLGVVASCHVVFPSSRLVPPAGCRKAREMLKQQSDAERLAAFPSVANLRCAIRRAMLCIKRISADAAASGTLTVEQRSAATTALIGCLFCNSFGGRSREWTFLTEEYCRRRMEEAAATERDCYFQCKMHKTYRVYGAISKYVPPGNVQAILVSWRQFRLRVLVFVLNVFVVLCSCCWGVACPGILEPAQPHGV